MGLIVTLAVDLFLTAFFYLFTPVVVCVTKRKLTHSQIKTLVVINGAIIWFGFAVVRISIGDKPGLSGIVLWSAIAYWLLKKYCLKTEDINAYNAEQSNPLQYSLSPADEQVELKPGQTSLSDMYYDGSADSSKSRAYTAETKEESHSQAAIRNTIIGITMVVLLLISLAFNVVQYIDNKPNDTNDYLVDSNKNVLAVAMDAEFYPFCYEENGEYRGIHIDIANQLANRMGWDVKYIVTDFQGLFEAVNSDECDVVLGVEATPDREEIYTFTNSYYEGMCAIINASSCGFDEYSEIKKTFNDMISDGTINRIVSNYTIPESEEPSSSETEYIPQEEYEYTSNCLEAGCDNLPNEFSLYCSDHECDLKDCTSSKSYLSDFCILHECDSVGCHRAKKEHKSYCDEHACADDNCYYEKTYSSDYCSFCKCDEVGCDNKAKDLASYCSEHECADRWCTSAKAPLSDYCYIHDDD